MPAQRKAIANPANIPTKVWDRPMVSLQHYSFDKMPHRVPYLPLLMWREEFPAGQDTGLHQHDDFCMLYLVYGGQGVHFVNGHTYNLLSGDVYILSPGSVHSFLKYQGLKLYCLSFPLELLSRNEIASLRKSSLWKLLKPVGQGRNRGGGAHRLHLLPEQNVQAEAMVAEIFDEAHQPPPGPLLARYEFFRLLAMLSRWYDEGLQERRNTGRGQEFPAGEANAGNVSGIQEIVAFCESSFSQPLTAKQLAARMFLSQSQFDRLFSRAVGMPPATYLRQLRLAHAHKLLRTTSLGIADIAIACGMVDAVRLTRAFRVVFGTTPSAYRRSLRGR